MQRDILMSAGQAVRIIIDCDTKATSGVVAGGLPDARVALEARLSASGIRRCLTLVHGAGRGDRADRRIVLEERIDLRRASTPDAGRSRSL